LLWAFDFSRQRLDVRFQLFGALAQALFDTGVKSVFHLPGVNQFAILAAATPRARIVLPSLASSMKAKKSSRTMKARPLSTQSSTTKSPGTARSRLGRAS
jgi:hypothetical protein